MRKLSLILDEIAVESFPTTDADTAPRGTVRGMDNTIDQDTCVSCPVTCGTCPATCVASCPATCAASCATCPASCACPSADGRC